ncbi:MAG: FAD-dependent oxidoreductase [Cyanobacteria bacterium SZAS-4]|nr:FAD-dependent oxidoreductase [Cyanobacteria bacterium SZAS-4]
MTTESKSIAIIGGGIAGLSLAHFIGEDCEILEKSTQCGGLCRSFEKDGLTYDLGGHVVFSSDKEILKLDLDLLKDNVGSHVRKNAVWYKGRLVKYPFENNLADLDKEDLFDCLWSFLNNPQRPQRNFEDWMYNHFGRGITERYLIPYNQKIWKLTPRSMATDWVNRIPKPPPADVLKSAVGIPTEGNLEQLNFYYPTSGGFQALPDAFERSVRGKITKSFNVQRVRKRNGKWIVSGHSGDYEYDHVVSTIPLPYLISVLDGAPEHVATAARALKHNSLLVVMLGVRNPNNSGQFGVYFPQEHLLFHRVCFYNFFGHQNEAGASPVVAEITANEGDSTWSKTDTQIIDSVIQGLKQEGFITNRSDVLTTEIRRVKHAYVVYDLARSQNLHIVNEYLDLIGLYRCGRFAEFRYINSDAVIRSAKNLAAKLGY